MTSSSKRKRIEILVDAPLLRRLKTMATDVGIKGYTVLPTLEGAGARGSWSDERVSGGAGSKVIFLTVTGPKRTDAFVEKLKPLLEPYGLVITIGDVEVLRPEKF